MSSSEVPSGGGGILLPLDLALSSGIHIGSMVKTKHMEPFIYKVRSDGVNIINMVKIMERIQIAAKFLARFVPSEVYIVSSRVHARKPVLKFCEVTGFKPIVGRFLPGTFTNPSLATYVEPKVVLVVDPRVDEQAVVEASKVGIPVISLVDTDNSLSNVDLAIPCNNKGRKALAMVFWLLAREVLRATGTLSPSEDLNIPVKEFEEEV
ncbi:MAG: 30S ribosomal protein S2 [Candidatus Bathyarchaeia archaeon]